MAKHTVRVRDMTQGSPIHLILAFAVPLFIGNIFQQLYSMVDTMVVGYHLGDTGIAAIGATAALYSLLINFANGLNNGYGIIVTQCFGAHDREKMKQAIAGMMILDAAVCLSLTAVALACLRPLMVFLNTPDSVFDMAYTYIRIICLGIVTTIGYNMFASILRTTTMRPQSGRLSDSASSSRVFFARTSWSRVRIATLRGIPSSTRNGRI